MNSREVNRWYSFQIAFVMIAGLSLAFFGGYVLQTYQTDTYAEYFYDLKTCIKTAKETARYGRGIYMLIAYKLLGNPTHNQLPHVLAGIIINGIIIFKFYSILYKKLELEKKEDIINYLVLLASIMMRINVFQSDIFQYGYAATITFIGDGLALMSAIYISKEGGKKNTITACILLMGASSFTQASLFWFVLYSMVFYFCGYILEENIYRIWWNLFKRIGVYLSAVIWSVICFKFFVPDHLGNRGKLTGIDFGEILNSLKVTFNSLFYDCMGVMPQYFYSVLLLVAICLLIFVMRKSIKSIVVISMVIGGVLLASFATVVADLWLPHRTLVGFMCILPLISIMIVIYDIKNKGKKKLCCTTLLVMFLYLSVSWYKTIDIYKGQIITNALDQENASFYYDKIQHYEQETNIKVLRVVMTMDPEFTNSFPNVLRAKSINERAYSTSWGRREIIHYSVGHQFESIEFNAEAYEKYFNGKSWDIISEEQVIFEGDTVYIALY